MLAIQSPDSLHGTLSVLMAGDCGVAHKTDTGCVDTQESDALTQAMKDLAEEFPDLMRPLIEERDEYMVFLLRALASRWCSLTQRLHF